MKKLIVFSTALLLSLSLMGCTFNRDRATPNKVNNNAAPNEVVKDNTTNHTNQGAGVHNNTGHETKLEVAEDAADRVAELEEVESATVIVTNRNAYVAVVMKDHANKGTNTTTKANTNTNTNTNKNKNTDTATTATEHELPQELEKKIADRVREADKNIENVYVSLNPEFVERMTEYRTKINEGRPVAGFFEEFTESVRNVFPHAH